MIRQVAYVMSLNFSGSTILSLALSLLRGSYFVGEPAESRAVHTDTASFVRFVKPGA
jgi:hypothetical protein